MEGGTVPLGEAILLLFLAVTATGGAIYGVVRWDLSRRWRLQGERNARKLLKESHVCAKCDVKINPAVDVYYRGDTKLGTWWCRDCFRTIIN